MGAGCSCSEEPKEDDVTRTVNAKLRDIGIDSGDFRLEATDDGGGYRLAHPAEPDMLHELLSSVIRHEELWEHDWPNVGAQRTLVRALDKIAPILTFAISRHAEAAAPFLMWCIHASVAVQPIRCGLVDVLSLPPSCALAVLELLRDRNLQLEIADLALGDLVHVHMAWAGRRPAIEVCRAVVELSPSSASVQIDTQGNTPATLLYVQMTKDASRPSSEVRTRMLQQAIAGAESRLATRPDMSLDRVYTQMLQAFNEEAWCSEMLHLLGTREREIRTRTFPRILPPQLIDLVISLLVPVTV